MKLGLFSDLHIHPFPAFASIGPGGYNSRIHQISQVADRVFDEAAKAGCKGVLFGGDWFHDQWVDREQLDLSGRVLAKADQLGLTVGMVPGNHDMAAEGGFSPVHSLRGFGRNIRLVDEGALEFGQGGLRVAGLPYHRKRDELVAKIKLLKRHDILLLHAPCVGAEMASDLVSMENDEAISADQLLQVSKAKLVVCGHYHKPQAFTAQKGWLQEIPASNAVLGAKLLIPGAPCHHGFSDCGQTRGWWELDTEKMGLKFHPIRGLVPEFVEVSYKEFLKDPGGVVGKYVNFTLPETLKKTARLEVLAAVREAAAGMRPFLEPALKKALPPRTDLSPAVHPSQALATYAEVNVPPDKKRTMQLGLRAIDAALQEGK